MASLLGRLQSACKNMMGKLSQSNGLFIRGKLSHLPGCDLSGEMKFVCLYV